MLNCVGKLQFICLIGGAGPNLGARPPIRQINCSLPTRINIDLKKFVTF